MAWVQRFHNFLLHLGEAFRRCRSVLCFGHDYPVGITVDSRVGGLVEIIEARYRTFGSVSEDIQRVLGNTRGLNRYFR